MKTYTKILMTTLPLVFFFLISTGGISYYFSHDALTDLAEEWLSTRVSEAVTIAGKHEDILHRYGLEKISASVIKAKLDAAKEISALKIGKSGYFMGIDTQGVIVFHPSNSYIGENVSDKPWFNRLKENKTRLFLSLQNEKNLAICSFFPKWNWYILALGPEKEVYGLADQMKPYLISLGISAAIIISLALMVLTQRLLKPLSLLLEGAERIGKGDLDTQIYINSHDEFSLLAKSFNRMTEKLKKSQTALKYREEYFRSLIENATDLVTVTDDKGILIYASPSVKRILGYDIDEMIGKTLFHYSHPDETEDMIKQFTKRIQTETTTPPIEFRIKHKHGYWCTMESISRNLLTHPAVKGLVINSRNISKQKFAQEALKKSHEELEKRVAERTRELVLLNQTLSKEIQTRMMKEAELKKASQAKNEFLANISHEIRTPLNAIIGFSELLSTLYPKNQEKNYLDAIQTAGRNLLSLINDILDLSKMEAYKLQLNRGIIDLHKLIDDTYKLYKARIEEKSITFIKNLDGTLPEYLIMDDIRLQQIMTNLIDNAVKFTSKGHIKLTTQKLKTQKNNSKIDLSISIEDTGIGIPKDNLNIIFDSFQQSSPDISREFGGTGLGLSICRHLVELMGGCIQVESIVGKGSVFKLILPEIEISQNSPETDRKKLSGIKTVHFSGETVLIADQEFGSPKVLLSARGLRHYCLKNSGLKEKIDSEIFQLIPEFDEGIKIADVQRLIQNIIRIGETFHLPEMTQFGQVLFNNAQSFDIKKLERLLKQLYNILNTII